MSAEIYAELRLSVIFILFGVGVGIAYDLLLIGRILFSTRKGWISVQDFLFGPIWGLQYFYEACKHNDGITRWYMIAGVFLGAFLWHNSLGYKAIKFMSTLKKRHVSDKMG